MDTLQKELKAKSLALTFKIVTSSLTGAGFYSGNEPNTMKVALKREREGGGIPRSYFFKGPSCIFIMEDFACACVCVRGD